MPDASVAEIAQALYAYIKQQYDDLFQGAPDDQRPALGFYVAGYSGNEPLPDEYEFLLPRDDAPTSARPPDEFGASWRGIDVAFTRIYKGLDPGIVPALLAKGFTDAEVQELFDAFEIGVLYDGMPVQDAINFCTYILDTTIGWTQFQIGAPTCGPPLQVATVLFNEGFRWVAKPEFRLQTSAYAQG